MSGKHATARIEKAWPWLLLGLLFLVAAALRLWGLPDVPPGPHYDEAANGILAAEIANGTERPIFIPSYTGKEVLFFYGVAAAMRVLGTTLLALRLTSALFGLLTVAATAWLAYELFADDDAAGAPWLAVLTATLLATSFWHLIISRVGFRAVTQPLLQALTLAALWRGLRRHDRRWVVLAGLFCGLTAYTYLAARAFPVPLAVTLLALALLDKRGRRQRWMQLGLFGLAALVIFAPLGLYFLRHPDAFTTRMGQVGPGEDWRAALDGVRAAFNMLFVRGDPYIRFNLPHRPLFNPVVALFFVLGLGLTAWRLFGPSTPLARSREILLLVWLPVMLLPTALAVGEITPSNLRAVGLIPLIFVFPARGVLHITYYVSRLTSHAIRTKSWWTFARDTQYVLFSLAALLLAGTAFTTAHTYFGAYAPRSDLYEAADGDLADIAAFLDHSDLTDTTVYVGSVHFRHPTLAFLADAYPRIKWLVGGSTVVYPAQGAALYLFPRSATPDAAWLARHLPGAAPVEVLPASDGAAAFVGYELAAPPAPPDGSLAEFSGVVRLLHYEIEEAVSGDAADVTLTWEILAPPPHTDLTPFYHLTDPWGFRWGQAEPFHYAAADWTPGEVVVERVGVPVAPGAPPGDYRLNLGFYSQSAGERLAVVDAAGRYAGTTTPLTLTLARAEAPPDPTRLGIRRPLSLETEDGLALLGVNLDSTRVRPGERIYLSLFWRAPGPLPDYTINLFLEGPGGQISDLYRGGPVHGSYPTDRWTAGEVVVDRYDPRLPLAAHSDAAPPGDYALKLKLTNAADETRLGPAPLGQLALLASERSFEVPTIRNTQYAVLSNRVALLGYDLDLSEARPGGALSLTLFWRALSEMEIDYTVFTHLIGPAGDVPAQQDNQPVNGTYPTTLWLPGEVVTDPYVIDLPPDLAPGEYALQVGFYIAENGLRLGDPILLDTSVSISR